MISFATRICQASYSGDSVPCFHMNKMIKKSNIESLLTPKLLEKGGFLVSLSIDKQNNIIVKVDSIQGFTISDCVDISRAIEGNLDREEEDFSLEVSTPGLNAEFKVWEQYKKNEDRKVEILKTDGEKTKGILQEVGKESFWIQTEKKTKIEGKKKKEVVTEKHEFQFSEIKKARLVLDF